MNTGGQSGVLSWRGLKGELLNKTQLIITRLAAVVPKSDFCCFCVFFMYNIVVYNGKQAVVNKIKKEVIYKIKKLAVLKASL